MDSECMTRNDQGVAEEWIVRVDGREYGPANIDTLREWKAEGRVLPANEARRTDAELWTLAGEIPGLFNVEALGTASALAKAPPAPPPQIDQRFEFAPRIALTVHGDVKDPRQLAEELMPHLRRQSFQPWRPAICKAVAQPSPGPPINRLLLR